MPTPLPQHLLPFLQPQAPPHSSNLMLQHAELQLPDLAPLQSAHSSVSSLSRTMRVLLTSLACQMNMSGLINVPLDLSAHVPQSQSWDATCPPLDVGFCDFGALLQATSDVPSSALPSSTFRLPADHHGGLNHSQEATPKPHSTQAPQNSVDPFSTTFDFDFPLNVDQLLSTLPTPPQSDVPAARDGQALTFGDMPDPSSYAVPEVFGDQALTSESFSSLLPTFDAPPAFDFGATYGSADTDFGSLLDPLVTLPSEAIWPDKLKEFGICLDY